MAANGRGALPFNIAAFLREVLTKRPAGGIIMSLQPKKRPSAHGGTEQGGKNKQKVNEVFNKLEDYYLANKSKNIYFTLLGDACECNKETYEKDEEIKQEGLLKVNELNKKYHDEIFYFAYRTRIYSESEESFLGFERKRGALLHFNDLILNNLSEEEKTIGFKFILLIILNTKLNML